MAVDDLPCLRTDLRKSLTSTAARTATRRIHRRLQFPSRFDAGPIATGKRNAFSRGVTNDTATDQKRLPDSEICRTAYVAQSDVSQCLVDNPDACQFAIRYGSGVICRHYARRRFERSGPLAPPP